MLLALLFMGSISSLKLFSNEFQADFEKPFFLSLQNFKWQNPFTIGNIFLLHFIKKKTFAI